ncbi:heavy metal-binding domain-containing protein [Halobacteriovorax sp. HLS]|uniref:heavy metal-binding domain-containing protein n=1 Tax=Halobacteriovorax sp. HLS TaxID=2234000 RepID=UPI000FDB08B8|nr:heavy metal-binding domain-containing protein [Halobacteriovorax sp. HLS]
MSGDDDIGEKTDLTRIEDLSEFLHQNDPEIDAQLDSPLGNDEEDTPPPFEDLSDLNDLEDENEEAFGSEELEQDDQFADFESENSEFDESTQPDLETDFTNSDSEDDSEDEFPSFDSQEDNEDDIEETSDDDNSFDSFSDQEEEDSTDFLASQDDEEQEDDEEFNSFSEDLEDLDDDNEEVTSFSSDSDDSDDSDEDNDDQDDEDNSYPEQEEETTQGHFDSSTNTNEQVTQAAATSPTLTRTYIDKSEKFDDVKKFAQNITYGKIAHGGNPAYSIILRNIKFEEDADDIMILLNEHGLVDPENEQSMRDSVEGGSLLISQISEFAAIYLTHKFRRFELDIQMGLSDELHPSKSYDRDSVGLVSKYRTNQNKSESVRLEKSKVDVDSIILSTTPSLEDYKILEYLGVISEFTIVSQDELTADSQLSEAHAREAKGHLDAISQDDIEEEPIAEITLGHSDVYNDLLERLKPNCIKLNANAVVGINFQITPINNGDQYKITCSGSAVWVMDLN